MSQFWFYAACLSLLAVVFVLWPLLRRQKAVASNDRDAFVLDLFNEQRAELQEQLNAGDISRDEYQQLSAELEQSLLEDARNTGMTYREALRWPLVLLSVVLVLGTVIFYVERGAQGDLTVQRLLDARYQDQMVAMQERRAPDPSLAEALLKALEERVEADGEQPENRYLLARLAAEEGRYGMAVQHYTHLLQTTNKEEPQLMAELAQVVFLASDNRMTPEVNLLVSKVLELDPKETTALGLAGIGSFEKGDFVEAVDYWRQAVALMPPNAPVAQGLLAGIERAEGMMSTSGIQSETQLESESPKKTAKTSIRVAVSLAERAVVNSGAQVLVFARQWGAKMPLAISRFPVANLPSTVVLDETMSMMPGVHIGTVDRLEVVVRISSSGGAKAQSGDWQESIGPLVLNEINDTLEIIVSKQLP